MLNDIEATYKTIEKKLSSAIRKKDSENIIFLNNHLISLNHKIRQLHEICHLFKRELSKYPD